MFVPVILSESKRPGYFIALHDFNDNSSTAGGNLLIDGNPAEGTSIHLDYPGTDSRSLGTSFFEVVRSNRIGPSERIPGRVSVWDRDAEATTRQAFGPWEGDLMLFSTYGQAVLVAHERTSRVCFYRKQPDKQALNVFEALRQLFAPLPSAARRSITFDNGTEFSLHQRLTQELNIATYFCDKYSPWQKGGVENAIGRARRDIPRKTDLANLSQDELDGIARKHNHTPRKCLDYQTPAEAFLQHLNTLHFNCESTFPPTRE